MRAHPRLKNLTSISSSPSRRASLTHYSAVHESVQGCHSPYHPQLVPKQALDQAPSRQWTRCWLLIVHWLKFHRGRWSSLWRGRTAGCSSSAAPWRRRPIESCWGEGVESTSFSVGGLGKRLMEVSTMVKAIGRARVGEGNKMGLHVHSPSIWLNASRCP